jgi:ParB family chromosome partitioning protein
MIAIDSITVLNPRHRDERLFLEILESIKTLGLKKPISVSRRPDGGYDLAYGEGRMKAFTIFGETHIPALVSRTSEQECLVVSLVENLARRQHSVLELIGEIGALKNRGDSFAEIARKTGLEHDYVQSACYLLGHREARLLAAVERGAMPMPVAVDIAKAKTRKAQADIVQALERRGLPSEQLFAIRSIVDRRASLGKGSNSGPRRAGRQAKPRSTVALLAAYEKETARQRLLVSASQLTSNRLNFVVEAIKRLLSDEHFETLLRAEAMDTMPGPLVDRLNLVAG